MFTKCLNKPVWIRLQCATPRRTKHSTLETCNMQMPENKLKARNLSTDMLGSLGRIKPDEEMLLQTNILTLFLAQNCVF